MSEAPETVGGFEVDLTNCDHEPIHLLGRIQPFGCLIAITRDWIVTRVSDNVGDYLAAEPGAMLGLPLGEFVDAQVMHTLRGRAQVLSGEDAVERIFGLALGEGKVDAALHSAGDVLILEIERHAPAGLDYAATVRTMIARAGAATSVQQLAQLAARHVRALTGFDRVMVYRFREDDSGEVIAEARHGDAEPFLGLRYPASDIPRQARALYRRNILRIISDVNAETVAVRPELDPARRPLDLSMSTLRAVSPIHLEYLRNMGVEASLSISILCDGRLWGLFACHHETPRVLSYEQRTAAELYGQLFSFVLERTISRIAQADQDRAREVHDRLMAHLAGGSSMLESLHPAAETLRSVIRFDGVALYVDGDLRLDGSTPTAEEFLGLVRWLNTATADKVFATDWIAGTYERGADFTDRAAGLLAIPVSRKPRDYMVLFRREMARTVTWAGNPDKPVVATGPNGVRLTPRKSFEAWREVVQGHSEPWASSDIRAAEQLRVTLLEVVLRLSDAAERDRREAENRQELLIAELNHRVRNILNLIRGLVTQSQTGAGSVAEFTSVIGGRIHALSRAHDQITRDQWNPGSFREMLETEVQAFLNDGARLDYEGPDLLIKPVAFTSLALVMHELVTNAAKYGSLSDSSGRVELAVRVTPTGDAEIEWREVGGPPVQPPMRRGFGSTIIERTVPYDLKGEAQLDYQVTGLRAWFRIPSTNIAATPETAAAPAPSAARGTVHDAGGEAVLKGRHVLVLEDNMIIALEAEEVLKLLGAASVTVAASVAEAVSAIERRKPDIGVLDVNLGTETSVAAALRLSELEVPFLLATGYGDIDAITTQFPAAPVVQKPFSAATLHAAISKLL